MKDFERVQHLPEIQYGIITCRLTRVRNQHGPILQRLRPQIRVWTIYWSNTDDCRE